MKNRTPPAEEKEVTVAKINLKNSIIIALISAVSGIVVTYLTLNRHGSGQQHRSRTDEIESAGKLNTGLYYMKIRRVDLEPNNLSLIGIRIKGRVENNPVVYPVNTLWADIGSKYSSTAYPLKVSDNFAFTDLSMQAIDKDGKVFDFYSTSNAGHYFEFDKVPYVEELPLYHQNNGQGVQAKIILEFKREPF